MAGHVRFGNGPHTLVVLPGMALDNGQPGRLTAAAYAQSFRPLARRHTVHIVRRRPGLAPGTTTRDLADRYAETLRAEIGPARIMGLSTGGLIAQELAVVAPELVERLVLVVTGARIAPAGRELCERWRSLAVAGRWGALRGELAAVAVDGSLAQRLARLLGRLSGRAPAGTDGDDFLATVDAVLAHDATATLAGVKAPTLVIGGAVDPFFPAALLRETAAAVPDARLRVYEDSGHGLPKRHGSRMQSDALSFLTAP
jgi:pimeloyl-ACP methyl ester carboxylesterase